MATVDKQSVRDEFDKIKSGFQEQVAAGKVSTEVATLFNTLMMLFNIILTIFMEKSTKKISANSSIPPSQTPPDDTSTTNKSKADDDKEKPKVTVVGNTRTVETVTFLPTLACDRCGEDLSGVACECIERRTKIDIIFEKTEEHVDVEVKQCPACDSTVKAQFPDDMPGPLQYGNGIKAYCRISSYLQMMKYKGINPLVAVSMALQGNIEV